MAKCTKRWKRYGMDHKFRIYIICVTDSVNERNEPNERIYIYTLTRATEWWCFMLFSNQRQRRRLNGVAVCTLLAWKNRKNPKMVFCTVLRCSHFISATQRISSEYQNTFCVSEVLGIHKSNPVFDYTCIGTEADATHLIIWREIQYVSSSMRYFFIPLSMKGHFDFKWLACFRSCYFLTKRELWRHPIIIFIRDLPRRAFDVTVELNEFYWKMTVLSIFGAFGVLHCMLSKNEITFR